MSLEWESKSFSDLVDIIGGGTPKTSIEEYWDGDIPWISIKDFNSGQKYVLTTEKTITELGLNNSSTKLLKENDIIISARGTVGEVAMIKYEMAFNQSCYGLRVHDLLDKEFVYYLLKYNIYKLKNMVHGAVFDTITTNTFDDIIVNVPPFKYQEKISYLLSNIDNLIEVKLQENKNLATLAKTIFRDKFIFYKGYESQMIKTDFGEIPESFEVKSIDEISKDVVCGKTPSTKVEENYGDKMPFITIPDMHGNVFVINTERELSEIGIQSQIKKTLPKNSICVSCIATAGLVSLTSKESQTNQQINSIICKDSISPYFVYLYMEELSEYIKMLGSGGSTTLNLNKREFGKIELTIPPKKDMFEFHSMISPLFDKIKSNQYEINNLTKLRDTLLPKLMSGEIDVSKINCDLK